MDWRSVFLQAALWFLAGLCILFFVRRVFRVGRKHVPRLVVLLVILALLLALIPKISFGPNGSGNGSVKGNGGGTGGDQDDGTIPTTTPDISVRVCSDHRGGYEVFVEPRGKTNPVPIALTNQPAFRREFLERLIICHRELERPARSPRPVAQLVVPYSFSVIGCTVLEEMLSAASFVVRSERI